MNDDLEHSSAESEDLGASNIVVVDSQNSSEDKETKETADLNNQTEEKKETDEVKPEVNTEDEQSLEKDDGSEKIVMTKAEKDAQELRIREIAERRATRKAREELEGQYQQKLQENQQSQAAYGNMGVPPAPSPNHVWVSELNQWIDGNQSVLDFMNASQNMQPQVAQQQSYGGNDAPALQNQGSNSPPPASKKVYSEEAENQLDECAIAIPDFMTVMKNAPVTPEMVNAACTDSQGLRNLYKMMKESGNEIFQISKLSNVHEQHHRMWRMNERYAQERAKKVQTKATSQAAPLKNDGQLNKAESELTLEELKAKRFAEYWERA